MSLQAISDATKVSVRHLEALERDDDVELPGGVFRRGIVQAYCRHLGLDEADWLARFPATTEDNQDWAEFAEAVKRNRAPSPGAARGRWWGVLLLLAGVMALGWAAWHFFLKTRLGYPVR